MVVCNQPKFATKAKNTTPSTLQNFFCHAMAQAISCWPVHADALALTRPVHGRLVVEKVVPGQVSF
jgi:hypothetical protein